MRKAQLELLLIVIAIIGIHSFRNSQGGFINGKLYPNSAGESVLAISGKDSVKSMSKNGYFGMRVKPGTWKVVISDKEQITNVVREHLLVNEGQNINLGEIRLSE
jgi:hypothetical protein